LHRLATGDLNTLGLPAPEGVAKGPALSLPGAEGPAREQLRERMLALLREEIEALEEQCAARGEDLLETTSPHYRDGMAMPNQSQALLMARMEDVSLRQVRHLTALLMQLQERRAAKTQADRDRVEELLELHREGLIDPAAVTQPKTERRSGRRSRRATTGLESTENSEDEERS
jgi:hypothetical protein